MPENGKLPEPAVSEEGIRVAVSSEEWVLYEKEGWLVDDELHFRYAQDLDALVMIVEKAKDWKLLNAANAIIPFEKDKLLDTLNLIRMGQRVPFIGLPAHTQTPLAASFYVAYYEARRLPRPLGLTAGEPVKANS